MKKFGLSYHNSLRPGLILNLMLVGLILCVLGVAHTWLGMRGRDKAEDARKLREKITQLNNQIVRLKADVDHQLSNGALFTAMAAMDIKNMRPIEKKDVVEIDMNAPDKSGAASSAIQ